MATARDRSELVITDPVALRALAHPARQRLITELYSGEVLTATEASRIVGLTPSATSYHLRALERAGIVARDEPSGDGRERPWRSSADSISIRPEAHRGAGAVTSKTSILGWFADLQEGLARAGEAMTAGEDEVGMTSTTRLWLTDAEFSELSDQVRALIQARQGRTRTDHPDGARPWDAYALLLPAENEPPPGL